MMAIDPNIAMGYRGIELQNPLAQYGQIAAIQNAQNQNALAQFQLGSARRQEESQNALSDAYQRSFNPQTGQFDPKLLIGNVAKSKAAYMLPEIQSKLLESETKQATLAETQQKIKAGEFKLAQDKLNYGLKSLGDSPTPQEAIKKLNEGVTKGYFDFSTAASEAQKLQSMTPEQYKEYRIEKVLGLVDAKDKLGFMLPKTRDRDIGGQIQTIQDNPRLPGYGMPIAGGAVSKTPTIGDITAQGQLGLAQQKFAWEKANPGFELKEAEDGSIVGVNKRTLQAFPVTVGGAAPTAPMAAPAGVGMPSARLPAPAVQAIPGMTSVLDQQAPAAAPAVGTPLRGKGTAPIEGERKAATLLQRLQGSQNQLTQALLDDPKAVGPQAFATAVGKLSTTAANLFNTEARQRVEAAQLDILDAALTLGTGAAYTKEQLENYRQAYFPAYGDEPKTIADKQARLQNVISAANIAAGKAAKSVVTPPPLALPNARGGVDTSNPLLR